jgi:hypothetical protein
MVIDIDEFGAAPCAAAGDGGELEHAASPNAAASASAAARILRDMGFFLSSRTRNGRPRRDTEGGY